MTTVDRCVIVGLGLLGGSIARAAKSRAVAGRLTAVGRHPDLLEEARLDGSIDAWTLDLRAAVSDADLVILATPVATIDALLPTVWEAAGDETLISDVGSIKGPLVRTSERLASRRALTFLGAHPMAGSEQSGYRASRADLFDGAHVIVTPTETTPPWALKRLTEFWERLGGDVTLMAPDHHDRIVAAVSHLPHLVAYALIDAAAKAPDSALSFVAQGFKDTTRIAGADPQIWQEIFLANRTAISWSLAEFRRSLDELERLMNEQEEATLGRELSRIRNIRRGIA
jgi:prephenate dehydrogenase